LKHEGREGTRKDFLPFASFGSFVGRVMPGSSNGVAIFEVVPGAQMKLEVDYNGATYSTLTTEVTDDTQLEVQTVPLTVHLTVQGADLADQRVDLLKSNDAYVTYTRTGTDGRAPFEVLPDAQHKLRSAYNDDVRMGFRSCRRADRGRARL
jgi:hypothetical protein